jgi:hypothetical protein
MNCDEFELIVLALARNQLMDASVHDLRLAHADSCARCGGRLASERFLAAGTAAVVAQIAAEAAPVRVEAALLAAFHEHVRATAARTAMPGPIKLNNWSFWRPAAVAALLLIVISTMAVFWSSSNSLNQGNEELTGLYGPVDLPLPGVAAIEDRVESAYPLANSDQQDRRQQRVSRRKSNQAEVVSAFYPLMEGEDLDSSEIAQVVRVELPASALGVAGVSLGADISTVPVKADVALGYDGLARAVRFVR